MKSSQNTTIKHRKVWAILIIGLTLSILLVMVAKPAQSTMRPARSADAFVNSIGVNTHLRYLDTAYNERYPLVKEKLNALGVRNVRDEAFISPHARVNDLVYGRYRELAKMGIRYNLVVDPRKESLATVNSAKISRIADMAGPSLGSFEGPNEFDVSGASNWQTTLRTYQRNLYKSVKSNPSTSRVPVIGPSMAHANNAPKVGNLSAYLDFGNMHPYPGGEAPGSWSLDNYNIKHSRSISGTKPLIPTETGYHTAANWNGPHPGVSEKTMGKYTPRLFLEYFNRGIPRTYSYQFINNFPDPNGSDREQNFGLLRNNGTEKPAYKSLKNLIGLLEDPGPRFKPGSLNYSLGGDLKNVHRTLLQKRDGTFYLVLWQEASSYNLSTKRDISVPARRVTLTLNQRVGTATTYLPNVSTSPVKRYAAPRRLALNVPDHPVVVKLSPPSRSVSTTNSRPRIFGIAPRQNARVKDRTPTIRATVTDNSNLRKSNIRLFVDGRRKYRFVYDRSRDRLRFNVGRRLSVSQYHRIRIVARDANGLRTVKVWRFKVVR